MTSIVNNYATYIAVSVHYFMEFIPYQKLVIMTDLSKEEVMNRLRERVGPKRRENFVRVDKNIFSGRLTNDKFNLILNKDYRNSWTPEITVVITETNGKAELSVTLKSNWFVIAFTTLFMIIGLAISISEIIDFNDTGDVDWMILALIIFPYGLCWFGFNLDADKSIDGLIRITKGEIK
jgi:Ca2+/Na+ antiporter